LPRPRIRAASGEPRDKTAIREREIFIYQSKYTIPVSYDNYIWQASRMDNPSSWLPVATITVRLKVQEEKKIKE